MYKTFCPALSLLILLFVCPASTAGVRYLKIKATLDWHLTAAVPLSSQTFPASGHISVTKELWDGIVGLQGDLKLGRSHFYIPYHFDIGTGSAGLHSGLISVFEGGDC